MENQPEQLGAEVEQVQNRPAKRRILSWKILASATVIVALVIAGGVWLGYDLSQRRTVPDLVGETLEGAHHAAGTSELRLAPTISEEVENLRDENTIVTSQTPKPGEILKAEGTVSVSVAGRDAEVPTLGGLSFADAEENVSKAEFILAHEFGTTRPRGNWIIKSQSIEAGSDLPAGSEIWIELDVPEIVMPDLAGSEIASARDSLIQLGLVPIPIGEGTHVASAEFPAGTVLDPFTRVELSFGYVFPNVVGRTFSEARDLLSDFSNIETTGSSSRKITVQSIKSGTIALHDAEILLTAPGPETVYRIIGNGSRASVTWAAPGSFSIQQANNAELPWEVRFPRDTGDAVFNAQILDGDSVTCQLERNGKVVRELTSTGPYAVVQC